MYGLDNLLKFAVSANKSVRSQSKEDIVLNKFSRTTRTAAVAAIAGLSLSLSMPVAFAEEPVAVAAATASDSPLVNPNAKGTLTIHKYADPTSEPGVPSGTAADADKIVADKLPGVGFTVYSIKDVDLTTNNGIAAAAKVKAGDYLKNGDVDPSRIPGTLEKINGGEQRTDQDGKITFSDLKPGAYLVVESGPLAGYTPAIPFIAFVPMTENNAGDNQGVKWNYDVHAFPKNYKEEAPTKTVEDKDQNVGDTVTYTVEGTVRKLVKDEVLTQFEISDKIDEKLQVTSVVPQLNSINLESSDYTYELKDGNTVSVKLTDQGLAKVKTGDKVSVKIMTKVLEKLNTGKVENTAIVYQNTPGGKQDTEGKPTPTVRTYWGGVTFKKVDKNHQTLGGAKFRILRSDSSTCDDVNLKDKAQIEENSVHGNQNGQITKEFTSANGEFLITGLHVNDFANNQEVVPPSTYCLVETMAPKGKELLSKAIPFQLKAESGATPENREYKLASVKVGDVDGEVVNIDDTTPQLPLTGGAGVGILAAIGAAIVAAGAWFARRNSSQNN